MNQRSSIWRSNLRTLSGLATSILVLLVIASPVEAQNPKSPANVPSGELTNPLLSPRYSQWVVGPVSWMLSPEKRDEYVFLGSDEEAKQFIEEFWLKNADNKELFDERAEEADKKFRELTFQGRRSDRGIIYILYGPPEKERYEEHRNVLDGNVALWEYPKDSLLGLDGRKPLREYRFLKDGDKTVFFRKDRRRDARRRIEDQRRVPRPPY